MKSLYQTRNALQGVHKQKGRKGSDMSHIAEQRAEGKSKAQRDRDLLLGQLREAATRSRLQTTIFENLGNQLRMGQLDRCTFTLMESSGVSCRGTRNNDARGPETVLLARGSHPLLL